MITVSKKPPVVALCDNTMLFEFTTDLASGTDEVFLLIQPWYDPSDVLGEERLYPAVPGAADTNLSEYLRSGMYALKQFVFPEQGNVPWNARTGLSKEYKIRIQECYTDESGNPVVTTSWLEDRYVVRGKIPRWKWAAFYAQYNSFLEWITNSKSFLTLSPKTLITRTDQVQKLYFLIYWANQAGDKITLKIDITFTDATTATYTPAQESAAIGMYQVFEFAVGYSVLGLADWAGTNYPGKTIAKYAVTAMVGETAVSETRTYIVDRKAYPGMHQFLFANSVGGYDTLMALGNSELNSSYDYEVVDQQSPGVQALAEKKQLFVDDVDVHICRTGYMNIDMALYMAEFFMSDERYEISGSTLIPVVLRNTKVLRSRDSENLYYCEFEYEHALNQKVEVG